MFDEKMLTSIQKGIVVVREHLDQISNFCYSCSLQSSTLRIIPKRVRSQPPPASIQNSIAFPTSQQKLFSTSNLANDIEPQLPKPLNTRQRLLSLFRGQNKLFGKNPNVILSPSRGKRIPVSTPPRDLASTSSPRRRTRNSGSTEKQDTQRRMETFKVTSPGRTPPRRIRIKPKSSPQFSRSPNQLSNQLSTPIHHFQQSNLNLSPSIHLSRSQTLQQLSSKRNPNGFLSPQPFATPSRSQIHAIIRKEQARRTKNEERLKTLAFLNGDLKARRKDEGWKEVGGKVNLMKKLERERKLREEVEHEIGSQQAKAKLEIPNWKSGMFKNSSPSSVASTSQDHGFQEPRSDTTPSRFSPESSDLDPPSTPSTMRASLTPSSIGRPPLPQDVSIGIGHLLRSHERAREIARGEFVDLGSPVVRR